MNGPVRMEFPERVLERDLTFDQLSKRLADLGFARSSVRGTTPDMRPGEPELAGFTGGSGRLTFTFGPVVGLRVLSGRALTPAQCATLDRHLPWTDGRAIAAGLTSADPAVRLWAVLAAEHQDDPDALPAIRRRLADAEGAVAAAAKRAEARLMNTEGARRATLDLLADIAAERAPALLALRGGEPEAFEALRPTREDLAQLFLLDDVEPLYRYYEKQWVDEPPLIRPGIDQLGLQVIPAPAGLLRSENELSRKFPGGYRGASWWMRPDRVWLTWRYHRPGDTGGMRFDGLAHVGEGRWVWCPKPFLALGRLDP